MKFYISISCIAAALLMTGCSDKRPDGFPAKLLSCRIIVLEGDEPLKEVSVSLLPENEQQKYSMIAMTDANGVANLRTTLGGYYGNGVPEGTYKILVIGSEPPDFEHTLTMEQRMELPPDQLSAYEAARQRRINALPIGEIPSAIPKELGKRDKTPLTWTVNRKGSELTVNIADYKK